MQCGAVGLSRYIDNRHHIEDIIGGWFLGALFAFWFAWECASTVDDIGRKFALDKGTAPLALEARPELSTETPVAMPVPGINSIRR
jgi:hypothetical protein